MGAISAGAKAGKESGQKSGKKSGEKAGQNTDPNGNRLAQDSKAAATGAAGGAAKGAAGGAAKGAAKGGVEGVKKGAEIGAKVGGAIPYAGVVLGPALGVAGGAVGGATGTALGGASGAISGAASGATSGAKSGIESSEQNRNKKGGIKDFFKGMAKNAKDAVKGDMKAAFKLKFKAILIGIIITFVIVAMFVFEITGKAEAISSDSMKSVMANSSSDSAELFNETGSLILATDNELEEIADKFFEDLKPKNESYYDAFKIKYSKTPSTVAKKISNITNNEETVEINSNITASSSSGGSGAASISQNRTIYEHILRTEKYNFNNITWRSFVKDSNGGVKNASMSFQVDSDTKLKYPSSDKNDTSNDEHTLTFFTTMVRPYLQSWYIPFDLAVGTQSSGSNTEGNINTKFAAEIIASAYHEIVLDRYKIETLTRQTNYLVYDKTTTTKSTIRTCGTYEITEKVAKKKGETCTKDDYNTGLCEDYKTMYLKQCTDSDVKNKEHNCKSTNLKYVVLCEDTWDKSKCSYGTIKEDVTADMTITKKLCVDTVGKTKKETEKDIRESKSVSKDKDNLTYRWDYVTSSAKTFDNATSTEYDFEAYENYSTDNYYNFINKKNNLNNVEEFKESEEKNSKADEYTHNEKDYNEKEIETNEKNKNWNKSYVVSSIPKGATLVGKTTSKTVWENKEIVKNGKEYNDEYSWSDKLNYKETKSGTYSVESVKDVIDGDLSSDEEAYYQDLVTMNELNLVDIMNADSNIYKKYLSNYTSERYSENIGYRRGYLTVSYSLLSQSLKKLAEDYPISGLAYGSTLGVNEGGYANLNGINFAAGGDVSVAIYTFANSCMGMTLKQVSQLDKYNATFNDHWCAMFASLSIRFAEEATGTKINIPNFAACTTMWNQSKANDDRPWFFDVIGSYGPITTDTKHLASLNIIQPGDILLIRWSASGNARHHADIVQSVERDASGNVTKVVTIDGNMSGRGSQSWNNSTVKNHTYTGQSLKQICSIMSIALAIEN